MHKKEMEKNHEIYRESISGFPPELLLLDKHQLFPYIEIHINNIDLYIHMFCIHEIQ